MFNCFLGICDLFGRIGGGWFADLGFIKRHFLMAICLAICSLVTFITCFAGICDLFGRIGGGWFADLGFIKRHFLMAICLAVCSLVTFITIQIPSFVSCIVLAVTIGAFGKFSLSVFLSACV